MKFQRPEYLMLAALAGGLLAAIVLNFLPNI
jgi:hypothetical protein